MSSFRFVPKLHSQSHSPFFAVIVAHAAGYPVHHDNLLLAIKTVFSKPGGLQFQIFSATNRKYMAQLAPLD